MIKPLIEDQTVVARNGAFDFSCLSQVLQYYKLSQPGFTLKCTYKIYGKGPAACCSDHNIALKHHDALSNAFLCATLSKTPVNGQLNLPSSYKMTNEVDEILSDETTFTIHF
jgi:DNA polymerase-3 subunit epsilon